MLQILQLLLKAFSVFLKGVMRRFAQFLAHRARTLRVSILTIFLSLTSIAFALVMTFSYIRNYLSILDFSTSVANRVSSLVLEKFKDFALDSDRSTLIASGFFDALKPISPGNPTVTRFILNILKYYESFSNFFIGLPNGNFLGGFRISHSMQTHFLSDENRPLPKEAVYTLRYIDHSASPPVDYSQYLDQNFQVLEKEETSNVSYDARQRPWYIGAKNAHQIFWTGFYYFYPTNELGLTVSDAVRNAQGEVEGVIGADLTFALLEKFLSEQTVGKRGKVFIIEENGDTIVASHQDRSSQINEQFIQEAFQEYQRFHHENFLYKKEGVQYLVHISKVPVILGHDWKVLVIFPLDDFLSQLVETQKQVIFIILGILFLSSLVIVYFSGRISSPIVTLSRHVDKITQLQLENQEHVNSKIKEIHLMDDAIAKLRVAIRSFASYVPKEIVSELIKTGEGIKLGGKKKEITIFFSDIENFTGTAEHYPMEQLTPLLEEYFTSLSQVILSTKGTIDKYVGDGIMAFWGAPVAVSDHFYQACLAALRCHAKDLQLNQAREKVGNPIFKTRYGLHLGNVIVGNIGTTQRMNYTIMGDAVNTASRLQNINKIYKTSIIISETLAARVGEQFLVRPLDFVLIRGKAEPMKVFELMAVIQGESEIIASESMKELAQTFKQAYEEYHGGDLNKAKEMFLSIQKRFPEDGPTIVYLEKIASLQMRPPSQ